MPLRLALRRPYVPDVNRHIRDVKTPAQIGTPSASLLDNSRYQPLFKTGWGRYDVANPTQELIDSSPAMNDGPSWILNLYDASSGNMAANDPSTRAELLAEAIPALSLPVGSRNTIVLAENYDMPALYADSWPREKKFNEQNIRLPDWRHSDMREVAYIYQHRLIEQLVEISKR